MRFSLICGLMALWAGVVYAGDAVVVGNFSSGDLEGWKPKVFKGETIYHLVDSDRGTVLKAESRSSASGLFLEVDIDLEKTPCLSWSWKVDNILHGLLETTKQGDDFPARIYVIFSEGPFFWQARALSYVWSGSRKVTSSWPNAFSDRTTVMAVNSGPGQVGQWVAHRRNIREDYRQLVGMEVKRAHALAVMSDTDNSGLSTTAYFGDISLSDTC